MNENDKIEMMNELKFLRSRIEETEVLVKLGKSPSKNLSQIKFEIEEIMLDLQN